MRASDRTVWSRRLRFSVALCLFLAAGHAGAAGPEGASVRHGEVGFQQSGSILSIQQKTPTAIVNWRTFSVGDGETVRFMIPSAKSAILNRVTGDQASRINGQIAGNGKVISSIPTASSSVPTGGSTPPASSCRR